MRTSNTLLEWLCPDLPSLEGEEVVRKLTDSMKHHFERHRVVASGDLANETWIIVLRKIRTGELSQGFSSLDQRKAFVFGVAKNVLRDWRKEEYRRKEDQLSDGGREDVVVPPVEGAPVDCQKVLAELIERAIQHLREPDRQMLEMVALVDGAKRLEEKARTMSIPYSALRKRISRARYRFKEIVLGSASFATELESVLSCLGWARGSS